MQRGGSWARSSQVRCPRHLPSPWLWAEGCGRAQWLVMVPQAASAAPSAAAGCLMCLASCIGPVVARSARELPAACPPPCWSVCHATVAPTAAAMPLLQSRRFAAYRWTSCPSLSSPPAVRRPAAFDALGAGSCGLSRLLGGAYGRGRTLHRTFQGVPSCPSALCFHHAASAAMPLCSATRRRSVGLLLTRVLSWALPHPCHDPRCCLNTMCFPPLLCNSQMGCGTTTHPSPQLGAPPSLP